MKSHDLKCLKLYEDEGLTYHQIADKLDLSYDEVKHALKRARSIHGDQTYGSKRQVLSLEEMIMKALKSGATKEELCDTFSLKEDRLDEILDVLVIDGACIDTLGGDYLKLANNAIPENSVYRHDEPISKRISVKNDCEVLRFGVISDTHLCSKHARLDYLDEYYSIVENEGISVVYHAGDLIDGFKVYQGHEYEVTHLGADEQADFTISNYPYRRGIKTKFISGNHDLSFLKKSGLDICRTIAREREDMEYLGAFGAYIDLSGTAKAPNDLSARPLCYIVHPDGGNPYAVSYRAQILARGFTEKTKPDIMFVGHLHQIEYFLDRGIHIVQAGAFQDMTPYLRRKGIHPKVGGWIIEVGIKDFKVKTFTSTFISFD